MIIRRFIKQIVYKWQYYKIKRTITVKGTHHNFGPTARVCLLDGSDMNDIVLDDYVDVFGMLMSQSHGKISIGRHSRISRNVSIQCVDRISIGNHVIISRESVVCDSNNHPLSVLFRRVWSTCFNNPKSDIQYYVICDNLSDDDKRVFFKLQKRFQNLSVHLINFDIESLEKIKPVYKEFKGWQTDLTKTKRIEDLPAEAKEYIDFISNYLGVPYCVVSVGTDRSQTIVLNEIFK